jgi:hypothetical protein
VLPVRTVDILVIVAELEYKVHRIDETGT